MVFYTFRDVDFWPPECSLGSLQGSPEGDPRGPLGAPPGFTPPECAWDHRKSDNRKKKVRGIETGRHFWALSDPGGKSDKPVEGLGLLLDQ